MWRLLSSYKLTQVIRGIFEIVGLGFLLSCWLSTHILPQGQLERPLIYYDIVDIRWRSLGSIYPLLLTASSHTQGEGITQDIHNRGWGFWGLSENSACHGYSIFFYKSTHFLNLNTFIKLNIRYLMCWVCMCMFICLSLYIYILTQTSINIQPKNKKCLSLYPLKLSYFPKAHESQMGNIVPGNNTNQPLVECVMIKIVINWRTFVLMKPNYRELFHVWEM